MGGLKKVNLGQEHCFKERGKAFLHGFFGVEMTTSKNSIKQLEVKPTYTDVNFKAKSISDNIDKSNTT